jgi:hypothetical protein
MHNRIGLIGPWLSGNEPSQNKDIQEQLVVCTILIARTDFRSP